MKIWQIEAAAALAMGSVPALAATPGCTVTVIGQLPVTMDGLRPLIQAKINGQPATFIADSGAFYSAISPGSAREFALPLRPAPPGLFVTGVGGSATVEIATVRNFGIAGADLSNIEFIVGGSEFGEVGLLGQNVLGLADVEYDLPHGNIRLMRASNCGSRNLAYWLQPGEAYSELPIRDRRMVSYHTVGTVTINGVSVEATFDTGSPTTILSLNAAARAGLRPDMPGAQNGGAASGLGRGTIDTWIVPVASIKIGDQEMRNSRIRIGRIGLDTGMLIGADFFISHRIFVSNGRKRMYFSYTGGPVFNLNVRMGGEGVVPPTTAQARTAPEPANADEYSRRGAVAATRRDYPAAIADFTHAIEAEPAEARYRVQRADAYAASGKPELAAADLDRAIELAPRDVRARIDRALSRIRKEDIAGARVDLEAAATAAAPSTNERLTLGSLFQHVGDPARAIAEYDLWITNHPVDSRMVVALNGRCWSRALAGRELPRALDDCNRALRMSPRDPSILDSRGLVHLRMARYSKAIADYDAALAIEPRIGWSLFGRGTAKIALGGLEQGEADIAAAVAIMPKIVENARKYSVGPQVADTASPARPPDQH